MKRTVQFLLVVLAIGLTLPLTCEAAMSPLSISVVPPVQFPPSDFSVTGARISLGYGHHRDVYGLDLGVLGNITDQRFVGIAVAGVTNITHGNTTAIGLQLAGVANINTQKTNIYGVQAALMSNWNEAESSLTGVQFSVANVSPNTSIYGLQVGLYNKARSVYGFQVGLVNIANDLHGLQIGLVNFNATGTFAVSPIINVGF